LPVKVGIITVLVDCHRRGCTPPRRPAATGRAAVRRPPPPRVDVQIINDSSEDPDCRRDYDLLCILALHSESDRALQTAHYGRRRGATTVFDGRLASAHPDLCAPGFYAIVIGEPEGAVPSHFDDILRGELKPRYRERAGQALKPATPRLDLVADRQVLPLALEVTRGCPFSCNFCVVADAGEGFGTRPVSRIRYDIIRRRAAVAGRVP
jgi:radical SAM superfamily enzyme YgiQ (UPF0313 family)